MAKTETTENAKTVDGGQGRGAQSSIPAVVPASVSWTMTTARLRAGKSDAPQARGQQAGRLQHIGLGRASFERRHQGRALQVLFESNPASFAPGGLRELRAHTRVSAFFASRTLARTGLRAPVLR
jgi:hypothetical protein